MNSGYKTVFVLGLATAMFHSTSRAADKPALTNQVEKLSYSIGMSVGNSLKRSGFEVDPKVMSEAIQDVMAGRETRLTDQQAQETIATAQQEQRAKKEQERIKVAEKNRKAGETFLAANKQKAGVKTQLITLPGGSPAELQYKVITEGTGESPKMADTVVFNFTAKSITGQEFDSSVKHGRPAKNLISHTPVRGLAEALQMMKPGSKWEIFMPASLAYGDFGNTLVEPGTAIDYEVELLSIEPPEAPQASTSDIIMVPSADQMKAGSNIVVIKPEDLKKMQTNAPAKKP